MRSRPARNLQGDGEHHFWFRRRPAVADWFSYCRCLSLWSLSGPRFRAAFPCGACKQRIQAAGLAPTGRRANGCRRTPHRSQEGSLHMLLRGSFQLPFCGRPACGILTQSPYLFIPSILSLRYLEARSNSKRATRTSVKGFRCSHSDDREALPTEELDCIKTCLIRCHFPGQMGYWAFDECLAQLTDNGDSVKLG
jgi:hypothetical protein